MNLHHSHHALSCASRFPGHFTKLHIHRKLGTTKTHQNDFHQFSPIFIRHIHRHQANTFRHTLYVAFNVYCPIRFLPGDSVPIIVLQQGFKRFSLIIAVRFIFVFVYFTVIDSTRSRLFFWRVPHQRATARARMTGAISFALRSHFVRHLSVPFFGVIIGEVRDDDGNR